MCCAAESFAEWLSLHQGLDLAEYLGLTTEREQQVEPGLGRAEHLLVDATGGTVETQRLTHVGEGGAPNTSERVVEGVERAAHVPLALERARPRRARREAIEVERRDVQHVARSPGDKR